MLIGNHVKIKETNSLLFDATGKTGRLVDILTTNTTDYKYVVELEEHPWLLSLHELEFELVD